jgi:hypothetical protein
MPLGLKLVIFLQIIPALLLPPETLLGLGVVGWVVALALFALLGINLWRRRSWSRVATIFVQGFSIIVRLLVFPRSVIVGGQLGNPVDLATISTMVLSMALSAVVMYYVDQPDIQLLMS